MTTKATFELCVLLPEAADACDACVDRLAGLIGEARGVSRSHLTAEPGRPPMLCLHYDPAVTTLAQIERLARAAGSELEGRYGHAVLKLRAIDAEDAARRIENLLLGVPGVLNASVSLAAQRARVEFDTRLTDRAAVEAALTRMGYAPPASAAPLAEQPGWLAENRELVWSLAAGAFLLVGWAGQRWLGLPAPIGFGFYVAAYVAGGWDLANHLFRSAREGRFTFDIDLLMLVAAAGAAALGEWAEGAFLLFLFSLAHALEHFALDRARGSIRALAELAPPMARVLVGGREVETPVEQVAVGDVVVVRPGERIPVDGEVKAGHSAVNQAPITGESVPAEKAPGSEVFAGTVNGEGALEVVATRAAGDRTLDRVVAMVEEAQTQKAPTQRFSDRFERIFVPAVLIADVLLIVVPPLAGWWTWSTSFYRGMALLAAASPCALALGTPSAVLAGIAQAARHGVLIKGGMHLENLADVRAIALDKTGTLTEGRPAVTDLMPVEGATADELLRTAAAVERRSQHPLAQAVVRRAEEAALPLPESGDLESLTARGVRSVVEGQTVEIGNARLWEEQGVELSESIREALERLQAAGRSTMIVRHGTRWLGVIGLADRPREGVAEVLRQLRRQGVRHLVMLTGDHRRVGETLGREVGVDRVEAELLPENKVSAIQALQREYGKVAMVGDGVNDAPALAHATVGIAMGGAGTAAALETADVALMADDLGKLPFALGLSRQARAVIRQNLAFSLAVVVLLLVATVTGYFGIGWAVLVHEGSTLIVIANALRLMAYRG